MKMILTVETWEDFWLKNTFWLGVCVIGIIIGTVFMVRGKRTSSEVVSQKQIFYGYGLFYYCYIGTRILFIFSDIANINNSIHYDSFVNGAYLCSGVALISMIVTIERYMLTVTKKVFSIISIAGVGTLAALFIVSFFNDSVLAISRVLNTAIFGLCGLVIIILYLILVRSVTGTLRRNALISLLGIIVVAVGLIMDMNALSNISKMFVILSPIITAVGAILLGLGQKTV
ncbi:MAG: hypothetical protein GF364_03365 [Candidatus Lokiarchaeota archaeon]|nr:hypothetical protein [Candidatus Lokiarchaeota archaeon]